MGVVTSQNLSRLAFERGGNIRPQPQLRWIIQAAILRRRAVIRIVWRTPGKKQQKRLLRLRMVADVFAGVTGLFDGVVTGPFQFVRGIRVVKGVRVVVRAFERLPVVEALTAVVWDELRASVSVQMPFADVAGVITFRLKNLGDGRRVWIERNVIEKDTVRQWPLSGQQRRPRG